MTFTDFLNVLILLSAPTLQKRLKPVSQNRHQENQLQLQKGHHSPSPTHHHRCIPSFPGVCIFSYYKDSFHSGCKQVGHLQGEAPQQEQLVL